MRTLLLASLLLVACGDDGRPLSPYGAPALPDGSGGAGAGAGASTSTGAGGAGAEGGGDVGGESPASACAGEAAFWATGVSFTEPTTVPLAVTLGRALYGYDAHGVTVVRRAGEVTVSATEEGPSGAQVLVGAPTFAGMVEDLGGFRTASPQDVGWMRIHDDHGAIDLELKNLTLDARAGADCSQIFVVLDAIIPTEAGSTTITLDGHAATVAELVGGASPSTLGWPIRALFVAETTAFDFGTLPP